MKSETESSPTASRTLGRFLREQRAKLTPTPASEDRRRTPGLRREEVATRANVSVTWYTFLEQGRGGTPSNSVLERLARALELGVADRDILFLLAQNRTAPIAPQPRLVVPPTLQRVLDAMTTPAYVRTITWDMVAWNLATSLVLSDYSRFPVGERNLLKHLFALSDEYKHLPQWEEFAGFAVAAFKGDLARTRDCPDGMALAQELCTSNAEFRRMWNDGPVLSHWTGRKQFVHPVLGPLSLDYTSYSIDGTNGLSMVVFTPRTEEETAAIADLVRSQTRRSTD